MKKLLITIASLAVLAAVSTAQIGVRPYNWKPKDKKGQFTAQSLDVKTSAESVSLLWLRDGLATNYTALAVPVFQVTGLGNRVNIVGLGAYDSNYTRTNIWAGTGLSVSVVESAGWSVKGYFGYKGFNLGNNFSAAQGKESFVFGAGITVPIR